jgi:DNA topoisomerase III
MGKILVLAEKPSVGRELARVLGCRENGKGCLIGQKYIVTWALGHLVTLDDPEGYDDKYKTWKMEDLPMLPERMKLTVIKKTSQQYYSVKELLNRKDIDELIIATDAGREGELVARWIIEKANYRGSIKRLWISSQTDKAIKDGFNNLKPGRDYENLYKAAFSRAEADWIVGLNVTRALTIKHNAQLSAGRVQTPTLAMIVSREDEIRNFQPKTFYELTAKGKGVSFLYKNKEGNSRIFEEVRARDLFNKLNGKEGNIISVEEKQKKSYSPALYDLTELQRDANKIYNYSAKETLSIMQRLYENYKILTYPRTDSRYLTADIVPTIKDRIAALPSEYSKISRVILNNRIVGNKSFVDDSKVTDHHAIIPTEEKAKLGYLNNEEKNIYNLVVKRFLSVLLPPYEYLETEVKLGINGETFAAKGRVSVSKGWKELYDREDEEDEEEKQELPKFNKGDKINAALSIKEGKTKPPSRFNEGTLLSAMENPQRYVELSAEAGKTLGETGGIGTVATRADIIEKLYSTFYIEKKGKEIFPTSKGRQVIDLVPEDLKSPLLTAKWEKELELISKGKEQSSYFSGNMRKYAVSLLNDVKGSTDKFIHDNMSGKKCPHCGKYMLEVSGKNGKMLVCQDRECGYRENLSRNTNARCPECHKKLEIRGAGDGQIYFCPHCSFREKASAFSKRFNDNDKLDKKEAGRYMQKMKNESEAPLNSALADALAKFNQK